MREFPWSIDQIRTAIDGLYPGRWFTGDYDVNLFGVRMKSTEPNRFDDFLGTAWHFDDALNYVVSSGTTDPGLSPLLNPINDDGTAILKPGHYRGCWELDWEGGRRKYPHMNQVGEMTVFRRKKKPSDKGKPDLKTDGLPEQTGLFGIEKHQENPKDDFDSTVVGGYSAGCQVSQMSYIYMAEMEVARRQTIFYKGVWRNPNTFSYTLLTEQLMETI